MHQCLQSSPDEGVSSTRDSLLPGDRVEPPLAAADAAASEKGRVLLLEDDPSFSDLIRDCLEENGYTVVAVQNGGEGVREVLARDFTLILCDFMMPGLPGDMFYRAVERIRPALCQRFIFMTGHQNDARTDEFIKNVGGFVLRKPFPLKNLLDSIALAEVRRTFQSVFEGVPSEPDASEVCEPADNFPAGGTSNPHASAVARILARAQAAQARDRSGVLRESETELPAAGGSQLFPLAALVLSLVLAASLWNRYWDARDRADAASAKRLASEVEWQAIAPKLEEAVAVRSKIELAQRQLAGISAERANPRWTPALRCIVPAMEARIDILEIQARGETADTGAFDLRVRGVAGGPEPRLMADRFRQVVEEKLKAMADRRPVSTQFEQLEDGSGALPDQRRTDFIVVAKVGLREPTVVTSTEGR